MVGFWVREGYRARTLTCKGVGCSNQSDDVRGVLCRVDGHDSRGGARGCRGPTCRSFRLVSAFCFLSVFVFRGHLADQQSGLVRGSRRGLAKANVPGVD